MLTLGVGEETYLVSLLIDSKLNGLKAGLEAFLAGAAHASLFLRLYLKICGGDPTESRHEKVTSPLTCGFLAQD